jgi:hypothetical protein
MKLIAAIALFAMMGTPKEYPARVRIKKWDMTTVRNSRTGFVTDTRGHGYANVIVSGKGPQGFDFTFEGCDRLEPPPDGNGYPARWKNEHEIIIVNSEIGSDKTHECSFKISLRNYVYVNQNGQLSTRPMAGPTDTDTSKDKTLE